MLDQEVQNQETQEVTQLLEQPQEEAPTQQPQTATAQQEESVQAKNFRELREKAKQIERERNEYARRLAEYEARTQTPSSTQEEDLSISIGENDIAEGRHLSKVEKKIKKLESQIAQYEKKSSLIATDALIKAQYPDFESVVTQETIATLRDEFPEAAQSLAANQDRYSQAVATYKLIKRLGYGTQEELLNSKEKEKLAQNMAKPRSLSSISPQTSESPLSRVNAFEEGLTPDLQKKLWEEMKNAMSKS